MMFDFYELLAEVKIALITRLRHDNFKNPIDCSWILYALSKDGFENNPLFISEFKRFENWVKKIENIVNDKDLVSICIFLYLVKHFPETIWLEYKNKVIEKLSSLMRKKVDKYSIFNIPEQSFGVTIGIKDNLTADMKAFLINVSQKSIKTDKLYRKILFTAVELEINSQKTITFDLGSSDSLEEIICALWLIYRYVNNSSYIDLTSKLWNKLFFLKDTFVYNPIEEGNDAPVISTFLLSILYETLKIHLNAPNPIILFKLLPLNNDLRKVCEPTFKAGNYSEAVENAAIRLENLIKEKSKIKDEFGVRLVKSTMEYNSKTPQEKPLIQFTPLRNTTEINIQEGLKYITIGIFKALRNPKAHTIKKLNPYKAIAELIMINYVFELISKLK